MVKFVPIFVRDFQLFAHPPWSSWPPYFVLGIEVPFVVGDVLWRCVRVSIAAVFGTVFAARGIAFSFLNCLVHPAALLLTLAAASSLCRWWGGGDGRWTGMMIFAVSFCPSCRGLCSCLCSNRCPRCRSFQMRSPCLNCLMKD